MRAFSAFFCALMLLAASCREQPEAAKAPPPVADSSAATAAHSIPVFNGDSAYVNVAAQVAFGPRVPGTSAQRVCAAWLQSGLQRSCDTVYRQETTVKGGDGRKLPCINLVGVINPSALKRVLLLAHWDTRPWAEEDTRRKDEPIDGADDGASGAAVLLELSRVIKEAGLKDLGVDILLTDVEDYGRDEWGDDSYCLGTQHWARNPHVRGYKAAYGILLDMVGARGAVFPLEELSTEEAPDVQQKVWKAAANAGYASFFPMVTGAYILDDHAFINSITGIPTIDIINLPPGSEDVFAPHWHTHGDNLSVIDRTTLKAVGQTLLSVIYDESRSGSMVAALK
jgi:hypothetical protein